MRLINLSIENYRSISSANFRVVEVDSSFTYTLIGINESGKSNFLTAVSLLDREVADLWKTDFGTPKQPLTIMASYELLESEIHTLKEVLRERSFPDRLLDQIVVEKVELGTYGIHAEVPIKTPIRRLTFSKKVFPDYSMGTEGPVFKNSMEAKPDFDLEDYLDEFLPDYFESISHSIIFWKPDSKHLIDQPINLDVFASDPSNVSIPLLNCFMLAEIADIPGTIQRLKLDAAEVHELQERLSEAVTRHINRIWPNHPIAIKFNINGSILNFLVADNDVLYKVKTVSQRSEGFRQFVSFLLTVSAESASGQLSNCILLLDEPETHLHPQAQEDLKEELIKLTSDSLENIAIFATHSNYMIDKAHMERCYRVYKQGHSAETEIAAIPAAASSYSEVNFEVFGIPSNDYHNELYGYLEECDVAKLGTLERTRERFNSKTKKTETVSLATYIRHAIHHPENDQNPGFTAKELRDSIDVLRSLRAQVVAEATTSLPAE